MLKFKTFFVVVVFALTGCANFQKPIDTGSEPNNSGAFLYGNAFIINSSGSIFGETEIALVISAIGNEEKYLFRFEEDDPLNMIEVPPGRYSIEGFAYVNHYNVVVGETSFSKKGVNLSFDALPQQTYYIGDYKGVASWNSGLAQTFKWNVDLAENLFKKTTSKFVNKYPLFSHLPNHDVVGHELEKLELNNRDKFID